MRSGGVEGLYEVSRPDEGEEVKKMLDFWDEMAAIERRMDDVVRGFLGTRARLRHSCVRTVRSEALRAADGRLRTRRRLRRQVRAPQGSSRRRT